MYKIIIDGLEYEMEGFSSMEDAISEALELHYQFSGMYLNIYDANISVIDCETDIEYVWDEYNEEWKDSSYSSGFEL